MKVILHVTMPVEPFNSFVRDGSAGCRRKMRMSGLCKVEMSAFMGGRGAYGNGANCLEPTRTGPLKSAA